MKTGVMFALLLGLTAWSWQPARAAPRNMITQAAFADGRLWLLTDRGELFSLAEQDEKPSQERVSGRVFGLCARAGAPLVVTGEGDRPRQLTLRRRAAGEWRTAGSVRMKGESYRALECSGPKLTLLTSGRIITLAPSGSSNAARLSESVGFYRIAVMAPASADQVYVGIAGGEWGGGLRRIDRRNGLVEVIDRHPSEDGCAGPLSVACDPVNGIAAEPWKPNCAAISIGLVHFIPHGRIDEICGNEVERIFFKPYDSGLGDAKSAAGEPASTVAFFGLVRSGDSLWAAGLDGLYRFRSRGVPDFVPMPSFRAVGDFRVSFHIPGIVLVLTEIDRRVSVSGAVPMIVAR